MDSHYSVSFAWMYLRLIIILMFYSSHNPVHVYNVYVANFDNKPYGKVNSVLKTTVANQVRACFLLSIV